MKVLVCGSRDLTDAHAVWSALDDLDNVVLVIHGGARGADHHGGSWARAHGVHEVRVPALWEAYGKAAGPRRNAAMLLLEPDLVLAFPRGESRGTRGMMTLAEKAGIRLVVRELLETA